MFLTLHLSWQALEFSWCNCKTQASTQIYVYPIPLETPLWGLWGFPPSPTMFANERNTCSIIIYRIICLFIILFFQKGKVDSGPLGFCAIYGLYWILHLDVGRSEAYYKRRRGFWKMSFVMQSWHFYDCEQVLKTSRAIIIIHRILWGGLRHGQWAFPLVMKKKCRDLQCRALHFQ